MSLRTVSFGLALCALTLVAGCEPTINVAIKVVQPCDQAKSLDGVGTLRFEIYGSDTTPMASNFSRGNKNGQISGLPLGHDVSVTIKGFAGDFEKDENVLAGIPLAIGASQPRDFLVGSDREVEIAVTMGKDDTFATVTDTKKNSCSTMTMARHGFTATYLSKVGKVLIVGGAVEQDGAEHLLATAELFDPSTGTFETLPEPSGGPRAYHAAVALPDGRALITGGIGLINEVAQTLGTGFVYDPSISSNQNPYTLVVIPTNQARAHHTATLSDLGDKVLIVGGCSKSAGVCERDRADNAFETTLVFDLAQFAQGVTSLSLGPVLPGGVGRVFHTAVAIGDGRILVAGGTSGGDTPECNIYIYKSDQGTFLTQEVYALPAESCTSHLAAVGFSDGKAVFSGGYKKLSASNTPDSTQLSSATAFWDIAESVKIAPGPGLSGGRAQHAMLAIAGSSVLIVGGETGIGAVDAERINLKTKTREPTLSVPSSKRVSMGAVTLGSGQALLLGGFELSSNTTVANADLFFYVPR